MEPTTTTADSPMGSPATTTNKPSRYESQKRRDWQTFGQYLRNHRPPLELSRCSGAHHHHQCHAPPAAAAAAGDVERRITDTSVPEVAPPHYLIPHAHFFHGHHFFPPPPATHYAADHGPPVPAGVGVAGEDVAMAMAEAHAAGGCMTMPLSVFY
ncbi:hypothetical protein PR202_ga06557 [Eleusine coracana subsp. coracana]|uniref:ALOG domain-containing protein n=1 Tax=Eleusine coracana subsp. coracana TaxID=191504 RepID=A0AAV5BVP6_ELECO|nr:hypothetical protein PR202_ga06557 [Eleusine coracana subsp. coracana]